MMEYGRFSLRHEESIGFRNLGLRYNIQCLQFLLRQLALQGVSPKGEDIKQFTFGVYRPLPQEIKSRLSKDMQEGISDPLSIQALVQCHGYQNDYPTIEGYKISSWIDGSTKNQVMDALDVRNIGMYKFATDSAD
ncbi:hypothetical protein MKW98_024777 [Papaver atlanticum]|uniref:Uncharacterized protein n=1 Tax=Papaver atlanticum TaxID=357466 RepID=A0AAD4T4Q2_9MAGN|nr:hypothetical protein MKW98_024777 [Papaver atlanticum]